MEQITIQTRKAGIEKARMIEAEVHGYFAIHPSVLSGFTITHIPTGLAISDREVSMELCRTKIRMFEWVPVNWFESDSERLHSSVNERNLQIISRICRAAGKSDLKDIENSIGGR